MEMNQIVSSDSHPADAPEVPNDNRVSEFVDEQNPAAHQAENPVALPAGQANGAEEQQQNPGVHQSENPAVPPAHEANGAAGQQQNPAGQEGEHPSNDPGGQANVSQSQSGSMSKRDEWISIWLRWPVTASTVLANLLLMFGTIALAVKSIHHHGIASANLNLQLHKPFIPTVSVGIGLAWTSVPSLLFQVYALTVATIVKTAGVRQPYIELHEANHPDGAAAEKSILLDYQSYWLPHASVMAFGYNHYVLGYGFVMVILLNIFLAPLGAHLFFSSTVSFDHDIDVIQSAALNWESGDSLYSTAPVLGTVSSTLTYGGQPIPWTTFDKSFAPIEIPQKLIRSSASTNLTFAATAYAAEVDCRILGPDEFELGADDKGEWYFSVEDRGCSALSQPFTPPINQFLVDFVQTYDLMNCSADAHYTRVLVIGARHVNTSSNDLANRTAISCIPSYSDMTGSLTVSINPSNPDDPTIYDFADATTATHLVPPPYASLFEQRLAQFDAYVDPTNTLSATAWGEVIYNEIKKLNPTSYLSADTLLNATESTFVAAFAIAASTYFIRPTAPQTLHATYSSQDTRVFVVLGVAWTIISLLALTLVLLGSVIVYTHSHRSILYEEPKAMVGTTIITQSGVLNTPVASILNARLASINADSCRGKVGEEFMEKEREERRRDVNEGWVFANWEQPSKASLVTTPKARTFGVPKRRT